MCVCVCVGARVCVHNIYMCTYLYTYHAAQVSRRSAGLVFRKTGLGFRVSAAQVSRRSAASLSLKHSLDIFLKRTLTAPH